MNGAGEMLSYLNLANRNPLSDPWLHGYFSLPDNGENALDLLACWCGFPL